MLGRALRRRDRVRGLPEAERADLGIGGEQLAERRRAGARQADDEHRCGDLLVCDVRVLGDRRLDTQPVDEEHAQAHRHDLAAEVGELGLALERVDQPLEPIGVEFGPEVARPRLGPRDVDELGGVH